MGQDEVASPTESQHERNLHAMEIKAWKVYDASFSGLDLTNALFFPGLITQLAKDLGYSAYNSFWYYTSTVSNLITLVCYLTLSPAADYGNLKRSLLTFFTGLGVLWCVLIMTTVTKECIWLVALIYIVTRQCFRMAEVFYLSFLLPIARNIDVCHQMSAKAASMRYASMLLFVLGCAASMAAPTLKKMRNYWLEYRVPIALSGLWWFVFSSYTFAYLGQHAGKPFPKDTKTVPQMLSFCAKQGIHGQLKNIKKVWKMKDLRLFMIGFFFVGDSLNTALSSAAVFAKDVLKMSDAILAAAALAAVAGSAVGLAVTARLIHRNIMKPKTIICCSVVSLICLVAQLSWIEGPVWIIVLMFCAGVVGGPMGGYTRSILASFIPAECEVEFFNTWQFVMRCSNWLGVLIIAILNTFMAQNYRYIVVATVVLEAAVGLPFLLMVNVERGSTENKYRPVTRRTVETTKHTNSKSGELSASDSTVATVAVSLASSSYFSPCAIEPPQPMITPDSACDPSGDSVCGSPIPLVSVAPTDVVVIKPLRQDR